MKLPAKFGATRKGVRLKRSGGRLIAEWYERRVRRARSWPDTPANLRLAKQWCTAFASERVMGRLVPAAPLTMRGLWELYVTANWGTLRPRTQTLYRDDWRRWEMFTGPAFVPDDVTPAMLHGFRRALERQGLGINSLRQAVKTCKVVFNWAEREELIFRNRWRLYALKVSKDAQPESPPEYRAEEFRALLAALDPRKGTQWRAWVALQVLGNQGVRQVAGLQLRWADLDLRHRAILWPKGTDKRGKAWRQPLRKATVRALRIARDWARRQEVTSPYVLYSAKQGRPGQPYTAQSFWAALRRAEAVAGVPRQKGRAGHGFRRMLVGDLAALTGDSMLALRSIGDTDPRMLARYRKDRDDQVADGFRRLDRVGAVSHMSSGGENPAPASDSETTSGERTYGDAR